MSSIRTSMDSRMSAELSRPGVQRRSAPRALGEVLGVVNWNALPGNIYEKVQSRKEEGQTELTSVVTDTPYYGPEDDSEEEIDKQSFLQRKCPSLESRRRAVSHFLHSSQGSWPSTVYQVAHLAILVIGMAVFLISTEPEYWDTYQPGIEVIEWIVVSIFTLDYLVRLLSAPNPLRWTIQLTSLLDLASILPFYIEQATAVSLGSFAAVRGFRVLRVFRVFRVAKITTRLQNIVWSSIRKSVEGIVLLCFFIIIFLFIFSTAMFYAEQSISTFDNSTRVWMREGQKSPYQSILSSFWWTIVTLTTVGYGDVVPNSNWGKFVGSIAIIVGILLMAFPVTIFTSHFSAAYKEQKRAEDRNREFKKYRRVMRKNYISRLTRLELQESLVEQLKYMSDEMRKATDLIIHCQENWLVLEQLAAYLQAAPSDSAGGQIERVARKLSVRTLKQRRLSF